MSSLGGPTLKKSLSEEGETWCHKICKPALDPIKVPRKISVFCPYR